MKTYRLSALPDLEADVMRDVSRYLLAHPSVTLAMRTNSGAMTSDAGQFVRFIDILGQDSVRATIRRGGAVAAAAQAHELRVPDFVGMLDDGRFLAIECKRAGWKSPLHPRELAQERTLNMVRKSGGVAGFVSSLQDLQDLLSEAGIAP